MLSPLVSSVLKFSFLPTAGVGLGSSFLGSSFLGSSFLGSSFFGTGAGLGVIGLIFSIGVFLVGIDLGGTAGAGETFFSGIFWDSSPGLKWIAFAWLTPGAL